MINSAYAKAYKEVMEIIKYFPEEEYNKIPKEKIEFYRENMDKNYEFTINPQIDLAKQNISKEASAVIVTLYRDYFATDEQKKKLEELIRLNEIKNEQDKAKKYNSNELFKNNSKSETLTEKSNQELENKMESDTKTAMVEYKKGFFNKFKALILKILHIK